MLHTAEGEPEKPSEQVISTCCKEGGALFCADAASYYLTALEVSAIVVDKIELTRAKQVQQGQYVEFRTDWVA